VNRNKLEAFKGGAGRRRRVEGRSIKVIVGALALFSELWTRGVSRVALEPLGGGNSAIITNCYDC
jgi:hypothetical protein